MTDRRARAITTAMAAGYRTPWAIPRRPATTTATQGMSNLVAPMRSIRAPPTSDSNTMARRCRARSRPAASSAEPTESEPAKSSESVVVKAPSMTELAKKRTLRVEGRQRVVRGRSTSCAPAASSRGSVRASGTARRPSTPRATKTPRGPSSRASQAPPLKARVGPIVLTARFSPTRRPVRRPSPMA